MVFFLKHSRFTGQQEKEEAISATPLYPFLSSRHLDIRHRKNFLKILFHVKKAKAYTLVVMPCQACNGNSYSNYSAERSEISYMVSHCLRNAFRMVEHFDFDDLCRPRFGKFEISWQNIGSQIWDPSLATLRAEIAQKSSLHKNMLMIRSTINILLVVSNDFIRC